MKIQISWNDEVTIYPNDKGFAKMYEIIAKEYKLSMSEAIHSITSRTTPDGGYKDQLWHITSMFSEMFFNGTSYFENTYITI